MRKLAILLVAAATLAVAGCTTQPPTSQLGTACSAVRGGGPMVCR